MRMPAIRDRQVVFRAYGADGAGGNGFLALCEVCRAGDETLHEELLDLVLKGADQDHGVKPRPAAFIGARLLRRVSPHALPVHFLRPCPGAQLHTTSTHAALRSGNDSSLVPLYIAPSAKLCQAATMTV